MRVGGCHRFSQSFILAIDQTTDVRDTDLTPHGYPLDAVLLEYVEEPGECGNEDWDQQPR